MARPPSLKLLHGVTTARRLDGFGLGFIAAPLYPSTYAFSNEAADIAPERLTFYDDGSFSGIVAPAGRCLLDGTGRCWTVPRPRDGRGSTLTGESGLEEYRMANLGEVICDDGTIVMAGVLAGMGGHAREGIGAENAGKAYANTADQIGRGRYVWSDTAGNGVGGVVLVGSLWPEITERQIASARVSATSIDYRWIIDERQYRLVGACLVNIGGLPTRYVAALGDGEVILVHNRSDAEILAALEDEWGPEGWGDGWSWPDEQLDTHTYSDTHNTYTADAGWDESQHPRANDGKFGEGDGASVEPDTRETFAAKTAHIETMATDAGVDLFISFKPGTETMTVHKIVVPEDERGSGVGSKLMTEITDTADANGWKVALSPSKDFGASSVARLDKFYKGFGFEKNKGKWPEISESMVREPVDDELTAALNPSQLKLRHPAGQVEGHGGKFLAPAAAPPALLPGIESGDGSEWDPFVVSNMRSAAILIDRGVAVILNRPDEVATKVDVLHAYVEEALVLGDGAPIYDLCKATVAGTDVFCATVNGVGELTMTMPQLRGVPLPNTPADAMAKGANGEVDIAPGFVDLLREQYGVKVHSRTRIASHLRASQRYVVGAKLAGITKAIREGTLGAGTIFTTSDDYVLDGHHRWAGYVADGSTLVVVEIDLDIISVMDLATQYATAMGITPARIATPPDRKAALDTLAEFGWTVEEVAVMDDATVARLASLDGPEAPGDEEECEPCKAAEKARQAAAGEVRPSKRAAYTLSPIDETAIDGCAQVRYGDNRYGRYEQTMTDVAGAEVWVITPEIDDKLGDWDDRIVVYAAGATLTGMRYEWENLDDDAVVLAAMPDGSFAIESLEDAQRVTRFAKRHAHYTPAEVYTHIATRAAALGFTDQLPEFVRQAAVADAPGVSDTAIDEERLNAIENEVKDLSGRVADLEDTTVLEAVSGDPAVLAELGTIEPSELPV